MKYITLFSFLLIASCKNFTIDKETRPDATIASSKQLISADQLMRALGATDFRVQLPDDLKPNDLIGLQLRSAEGKVDGGGLSAPWRAGEIVRVIIFPQSNGGLDFNREEVDFAIVSEEASKRGPFRGTLSKVPTGGSSFHPTRAIYKPGQTLIRYSADGRLTMGCKLRNNDADIVLVIKRRD